MNLSEKKQVIDSLIETLLQNKQNIQDWLITYVNMKKHTEMLDSFYFQTKLIDAEYELVQKIYKMIENRMYGEYYKLWLAMTHYTKDLWKDTVRFPPYKDLDMTKQYDSKVTQEMYEEITSIFQRLKQVTDKSQRDIDVHREQLNKGIHIENYINTLSYQLGLMVDQVNLFQNMFDSYQTYHHQRYDHFIKKIELLNSQIEGRVFPKCSQCEDVAEMCKGCAIRETNYSCELCHVREPVYCKECRPVDPVPEDPVPEDPVPEDPLEESLPVEESTVEEPLPIEQSLPVEQPLPLEESDTLFENPNDKAIQTDTFEFLDVMENPHASSPVLLKLETIYEIKEIDILSDEPVAVHEEQTIVTDEPMAVHEEQAIVTDEPVAVHEEQTIVTDEPVAVHEEQAIVTDEPVAVHEEQTIVTDEPVAVHEE